MKKTIILSLLFVFPLIINAQTGLNHRTDSLLKKALELYSKTTSFSCECLFISSDFPVNVSLNCKMEATRNPLDTITGFYYYVKYKPPNEKYFHLYNGNDVFMSYSGPIIQINKKEKPEAFRDKESTIPGMCKGFSPSVSKSSFMFFYSLFFLEDQLNKELKDTTYQIVVLKDTLIDKTKCLHYKFMKTNLGKGKTFEKVICIESNTLLPKYIRTESKNPMGHQINTALYRNFDVQTKVPLSYYAAENLLPKNWKENNPVREIVNWIGKEAPGWSLPTLSNDSTVTLSQFKGKVLLLEFTATWCPHCMEAAEMMNRLNEKFKNNSGTVLLSVFSSSPDTKDRISKFAERYSISNKILYNATAVGDIYKVEGYPQFFIIDSSGKIVKHYPGYSEEVEKKIVEDLNKLIKGS